MLKKWNRHPPPCKVCGKPLNKASARLYRSVCSDYCRAKQKAETTWPIAVATGVVGVFVGVSVRCLCHTFGGI